MKKLVGVLLVNPGCALKMTWYWVSERTTFNNLRSLSLGCTMKILSKGNNFRMICQKKVNSKGYFMDF